MSDLDDPEDAYDATDTVADRVINFAHRVAWIVDHLPPVFDVAVLDHLRRLCDDLATLAAQTR